MTFDVGNMWFAILFALTLEKFGLFLKSLELHDESP